MKRIGHLFERIATFENLLAAYHLRFNAAPFRACRAARRRFARSSLFARLSLR